MLHPALRKNLFATLVAVAVLLGGCSPKQSSQSDPKKDPNYVRGTTLVSQMDYVGAIEEFRTAIQKDPTSAPAHLELGFLFKNYAEDPAAAIYHFNNFLLLDPETDQSKFIRQNIDNCKMQLAKLFLIAPVVPNVQKELDKLKNEVKSLRQENSKLRFQMSAFNALPANQDQLQPVSSPAPKPRQIPAPPTTRAPKKERPRQMAQVAAQRVHTIQNGEYPAKIARRYGIKLEALLRANPGINPRKLQIGDKVKIPITSS